MLMLLRVHFRSFPGPVCTHMRPKLLVQRVVCTLSYENKGKSILHISIGSTGSLCSAGSLCRRFQQNDQLPFPQKQEIRRIQISHSQLLFPHPFPFPPNRLMPLPHPQSPLLLNNESSRMIQIRLLPHPQEFVETLLHPQLVAVKSLILFSSKDYLCFILCRTACQGFCFFMKN